MFIAPMAQATPTSLSEKDSLCETLRNLCASVVKIAQKRVHHRDTEFAQRTTEFIFPTDPYGGEGKRVKSVIVASCSDLPSVCRL